jgi:hypothetical protein
MSSTAMPTDLKIVVAERGTDFLPAKISPTSAKIEALAHLIHARARVKPAERGAQLSKAAISSLFQNRRGGRRSWRDRAAAGHWPRPSWSGGLKPARNAGEQFGLGA